MAKQLLGKEVNEALVANLLSRSALVRSSRLATRASFTSLPNSCFAIVISS